MSIFNKKGTSGTFKNSTRYDEQYFQSQIDEATAAIYDRIFEIKGVEDPDIAENLDALDTAGDIAHFLSGHGFTANANEDADTSRARIDAYHNSVQLYLSTEPKNLIEQFDSLLAKRIQSNNICMQKAIDHVNSHVSYDPDDPDHNKPNQW